MKLCVIAFSLAVLACSSSPEVAEPVDAPDASDAASEVCTGLRAGAWCNPDAPHECCSGKCPRKLITGEQAVCK